MCNSLWNCQTVLQRDCVFLHSWQQQRNIPGAFPSCQNCFFFFAIMVNMRWYLIVVSTCTSLITNYVVHIFMCSFPTHILPLVKYLIFYSYLQSQVSFFCHLRFVNSLYIQESILLLVMFCKILPGLCDSSSLPPVLPPAYVCACLSLGFHYCDEGP